MDSVVDKPKNKGGRPRKNPVVPTPSPREGVEAPKPPKEEVPEKIAGYRVADGFAWITIFPTPQDPPGKKCWTGPWGGADGQQQIYVPRGVNVCLPMFIINSICDAVAMIPEDDMTDPRNPSRSFVPFTRFPHSDPIPATWKEFKAFREKQGSLIHPNHAAKKR